MADVIQVTITGNATGLVGAVTQSKQALGELDSSVSRADSTMKAAFTGAAIAGAAALAGGLSGVVTAAAGFEKQMSAVGAVAGATAQEMQQLTSLALQLGKDTSFSAKEAAVGLEELTKAGVSVQDILGGAGRAALDLAAAGAIGVGDAAEIASNALNVFNLKGTDMAHVADQIAGAANASAIGVNDYKFSLSAAGAVAATVGIGFEDLTTAIAAMGNAGIKGSDAGTSLKTMLMNLQPSTKAQTAAFKELGIITADGSNTFFDASGKAKSFAEIAQVLQNALAGMTEEQKLATLETMFGSDAIRAAAVIAKEGAAGFETLAAQIGKVTAQQVANERLNNLAGSLEKLKGSVETAAIILGMQLTPALKGLVDAATDIVNGVIPALEQIPDAIRTIQQVFGEGWLPSAEIQPFTLAVGEAAVMLRDTFGPVITTVATFVTGTLVPAIQQFAEPIAAFVAGFSGAVVGIGLFSAAVTAVSVVLGALLSPIGLVAIAVGTLAVAWTENWLGIREATAAAWAALQPILADLVVWLGTTIPPVLTWISQTGWPALVTAGQAVATFITGTLIPGITQLIEWLGPRLVPVVTWISETGWPALVAAGTTVVTVVQQIIQFFQALYVELEKREVFTQLGTIWETLVRIGETVWAIIQKISDIFRPFQEMTATFNAGAGAALIATFTGIGEQAGIATRPIELLAGAVQGFLAIISTQLAALEKFLGMLQGLGNVQMPSWLGGGGAGAQTLSWRGAGLANPNASDAEIDAYIRSAGGRRGMSPADIDRFVRMSQLERAGQGAQAVGDGGKSFGPLQLYTGGGVGNAALAAGIDVRDPRTWQQQIEFGMDEAIKGGWSQWSVARMLGYQGRPSGTPGGGQMTAGLSTIRQTQQEWAAGFADANAICGPYLASLFAQAVGRPPTVEEAKQIGRQMGVYYGGGITNAAQFDEYGTAVIRAMGGSASLRQTPVGSTTDAGRLGREALDLGNPLVGFNTPNHYFGATGYDPVRGFNVGGTGRSLRGGSDWMTIEQIAELGGGITNIITLAGQMGEALIAMGEQGSTAFATVADGAATAGETLVTTSTDHLGNVMTIYQDATGVIGATITDASGVIVNQWGAMTAAVTEQAATMATAVPEQTNLMASGALTSVTNMGAGILTTVQTTSGTTIATVTDMQGQVTSQTAQMANGAVLAANGMQAGVMTSVTQMHDGTITTVQDMNGNIVTTVTDMQGNVTNQYVAMAASGGSAVQQLASESQQSFGEVASSAEVIPPAAKRVDDSLKNIKPPEVSGIVNGFKNVTKAAEQAKEAIEEAAEAAEGFGRKGGERGGRDDDDDNPYRKRHGGGSVVANTPYLIGRTGAEEYFVPSTSGHVYTTGQLRPTGGAEIDYDRLADALAKALPRGDTTYVLQGTSEQILSDLDRRRRQEEIMLSGQGPR